MGNTTSYPIGANPVLTVAIAAYPLEILAGRIHLKSAHRVLCGINGLDPHHLPFRVLLW